MPRKPKNQPPAQEIFLSGQLLGLALRIDPDKLSAYLDTDPSGFNDKKQCRDVLNFVRALTTNEKETNANIN